MAWYNQQAQETDAASMASLREAGWTIIEFSPEERAAISEAIKSEVWPMAKETIGADVFDRLVSGQ